MIRTVATRVAWPRAPLQRVLGWTAFLTFWGLVMACLPTTSAWLSQGIHLAGWWLLLPFTTALGAMTLPLFRGRRRVPIEISESGVRLGGRFGAKLGQRHIRRADITSGYLAHHSSGGFLSLTLRDGHVVHLTLQARADLEAALEVLGLTAAERRATLPLAPPELRYARAGLWAVAHTSLLFILLGVLGRTGIEPLLALGWGLVSFITGLVVMRASRLPEVEIGVDAIEVRAAFERRTIDVSDIVSVLRTAAGTSGDRAPPPRVSLLLKDGATLHLNTHGTDRDDAPSLGDAIEHRLEQARAARAALGGSPRIDRLAREGRPLAAWRKDLAALASQAATYRAAGLFLADLARIVADPDAAPEQRIGAALALGKNPDPPQQQAVRIAARSCISPKLRIALVESLRPEPDEALIEAALAESAAAGEEGELIKKVLER